MIVWIGAYCFGTVLGWLAVHMIHQGRPVWREIKAMLGVLFGAALQTILGLGILAYGVGILAGAMLYGLTLLIGPLRRVHYTSWEG